MSAPDPELQRLGRLVRRIAGPSGPPSPGEEITLADLAWNLTALRFGLRASLPEDHPLHALAREAEESNTNPHAVWREVANLPWLTVERIVDAVVKQRGIWDLEDHLG